MVRLEHSSKDSTGCVLVFQLQKGEIRTLIFEKKQVLTLNFNSIKVRLERLADAVVLEPSAFQFHKGAIRTMRGIC